MKGEWWREGSGIYLHNKSGNTIRNCIITDFNIGIYLEFSSNNTLIKNTVNNNNWRGIHLDYSSNNNLVNNTVNNNNNHGIFLHSSSNNNMVNNTVNNNNHGISLDYSTDNNISNNEIRNNRGNGVHFNYWSIGNTLNSNIICLNSIDIDNRGSNLGDNNTCDTRNNWNDNETTGCTFSCPQTICHCSSCNDCNEKLNDDCSIVILTADIIDNDGTCINNPRLFNRKTFDCRGHTINGVGRNYGIYTNEKNFNTIRNCIITDFEIGIYLESSSNNSLINNTVSSNTNHGIYLGHASNNNILINNVVDNNHHTGISLRHSSNNNILINNVVDNNGHAGTRPYSSGIRLCTFSNNNVLINNTANNNQWDGIRLCVSSNNNVLINNTANNNTMHGIHLPDAHNNNFTSNIVKFNRQHGFYASSVSTGNILNSNIFCSNNLVGGAFYDIVNYT